ncbi:CDP-alcohol phosphatidyltransferase family protein [Couchioplanes caeruleus]|uniref:CDP-alcohol phosphatidyltransferase family protein n=1 Tax=Couchioplanes caeruleus TaxID=56438 RepID=UPI0020C0D8EE|nr:CDP-alcohol phosphatidyltransferase family protein [Couchioplanes caeruleus]UQU66488.1 CDP-alcohol phosphatidyltransferase family protein [Couchioplanes caeruleus]
MVRRSSLREIREQTYKDRDAWWTVLLVDPVAVRLVRLVSPYRRVTPNLLTVVATLLGLGAAACFAMQDRWWLVAGALLFHVSFVVDCMDGKIARLNGTGSLFGAWFDFVFDRLRVFVCALALFGGQYARTGSAAYLWTLAVVVFLDLFRYLNSQQMAKVRQSMRDQLAEARGPVPPADPGDPGARVIPQGPRARVRQLLLSHRIRTHLVSGIEFEMAVFIVGPLTGWVIATSVVAGTLLLGFELWLILRLWQATRAFPVALAKEHAAAAVSAAVAPARTTQPERVSATTQP